MKKYVMYESLGMWYITTAENHNRYITDANKIIKLSRDFEEAKAIIDYNWHGFDDVEIIQK